MPRNEALGKHYSRSNPQKHLHGAKMPAIGYGTMELPQRGTELVAYAIQSGYRLIDTARKYGTEEKVGEGIRASGIAREELWVTSGHDLVRKSAFAVAIGSKADMD